ncbi:MAG: zinc-dependent peptidase [Oligoflexia bacterium]|nr:zinc-dependent peptidase [Oligoflexia bacterium]
MWHWIRDHRRQKILQTPFPPEWETILNENVAHYRRLDQEERRVLHDMIQVFIAEKHWEGCGGLALTDEIRVTIAAEACLMILHLPHDLYREVESIFIYPSTVITPERKAGIFEVPMEPLRASMPILGQAQRKGPVILVWDSVKRTARHPESGHNVVYHEFAHKLDLLDGTANGTPPLSGPEEIRRWANVCAKEFLQLRAEAQKGRRTCLDPYGATNEAEFFAVATEKFFDQPLELLKHSPELYSVLRDFYRQDLARRIEVGP